jgi:hypothetical protein
MALSVAAMTFVLGLFVIEILLYFRRENLRDMKVNGTAGNQCAVVPLEQQDCPYQSARGHHYLHYPLW